MDVAATIVSGVPKHEHQTRPGHGISGRYRLLISSFLTGHPRCCRVRQPDPQPGLIGSASALRCRIVRSDLGQWPRRNRHGPADLVASSNTTGPKNGRHLHCRATRLHRVSACSAIQPQGSHRHAGRSGFRLVSQYRFRCSRVRLFWMGALQLPSRYCRMKQDVEYRLRVYPRVRCHGLYLHLRVKLRPRDQAVRRVDKSMQPPRLEPFRAVLDCVDKRHTAMTDAKVYGAGATLWCANVTADRGLVARHQLRCHVH